MPLIGFVGAPCSGKTTTAATVFADLKDQGIPAEFIPEYARFYIAGIKKKSFHISLSDSDQDKILNGQLENEELFSPYKDMAVITDTSIFNTLAYYQDSKIAAKLVFENYLNRYKILFVCHPVPRPVIKDPNRVHTQDQSLEIHDRLLEIIRPYSDQLNLVHLTGKTFDRSQLALAKIMDSLVRS
jgi:nicotinamide riboside kinase